MRDKTHNAVLRQIKGMGCDIFEVGVFEASSGKMLERDWTKDQVLENISWLKHMNKNGNDIYIRPGKNESHGLVLLDDIDMFTVERMKDAGHKPACVVETSHKNLQAWLKLDAPASPEVRREVARQLAAEYDADPNSAAAKHYGRLAGFTNRKPEHLTSKGYPFVLCRQSGGKAAQAGSELVRSASNTLDQLENDIKVLSEQIPDRRQGKRADLADWHFDMINNLRAEYGPGIDLSRADWMFSVAAFERGYDATDIARALYKSDSIERKRGHQEKYIETTVSKAEVWTDLKEQNPGVEYQDIKDFVAQEAEKRRENIRIIDGKRDLYNIKSEKSEKNTQEREFNGPKM